MRNFEVSTFAPISGEPASQEDLGSVSICSPNFTLFHDTTSPTQISRNRIYTDQTSFTRFNRDQEIVQKTCMTHIYISNRETSKLKLNKKYKLLIPLKQKNLRNRINTNGPIK